MTAYLIVMIIIIGLGIFAPQQFQWSLRIAAFIGLLIFCGARIEVGPDWFSYVIYQNYLVSALPEFGWLSEPSFTAINIASEQSGWGIVGVNLLTAFLFLIGLFALAAKTPYPWCAIAVAFCYYIPALPMGIIRQAAAVGIVFLLVAYWSRLRLWQRMALVVFAMTFHVSAVIMFGVILASLSLALWKRAAMGGLAVILTVAFGIDPFSYFAVYEDRYIGGISSSVVESTASIFHWILIAAPATWYLLNHKKRVLRNVDSELMFASSLIAISLALLLPISSAAVTRIAFYFSYLPIVVGGSIIGTAYSPQFKVVVQAGVLSVSLAVLMIWLNFAENSDSYKPYQNFFTETSTKRKLYAD